jgi:hypothetical protein
MKVTDTSHKELVDALVARGSAIDLAPVDLWEMAGIERTIWYRIAIGERRASLDTFQKLTALGARLRKMTKREAVALKLDLQKARATRKANAARQGARLQQASAA